MRMKTPKRHLDGYYWILLDQEIVVNLLDIARALHSEDLDAWLETLNPEELKELWAQLMDDALKMLDQRIYGG